jgi:hypothetical protein
MDTLTIKVRPSNTKIEKLTTYVRDSYLAETPTFSKVVQSIYELQYGEAGVNLTSCSHPIVFSKKIDTKAKEGRRQDTITYKRYIKLTLANRKTLTKAVSEFVKSFKSGEWMQSVASGVSLENINIPAVGAVALHLIARLASDQKKNPNQDIVVNSDLAFGSMLLENQNLSTFRFVEIEDQPIPRFQFEKSTGVRRLARFEGFAGRIISQTTLHSPCVMTREIKIHDAEDFDDKEVELTEGNSTVLKSLYANSRTSILLNPEQKEKVTKIKTKKIIPKVIQVELSEAEATDDEVETETSDNEESDQEQEEIEVKRVVHAEATTSFKKPKNSKIPEKQKIIPIKAAEQQTLDLDQEEEVQISTSDICSGQKAINVQKADQALKKKKTKQARRKEKIVIALSESEETGDLNDSFLGTDASAELQIM